MMSATCHEAFTRTMLLRMFCSKETFDRLLNNYAARPEDLLGEAASVAADIEPTVPTPTTGCAADMQVSSGGFLLHGVVTLTNGAWLLHTQMLEDLSKFVEQASRGLGPAFLQVRSGASVEHSLASDDCGSCRCSLQ
jgi:hypothetical protein